MSLYTQAVVGQASLLWQRKDINLVIQDSVTDAATRDKLQLVQQVLKYAKEELNLPVGDSYSTYVATGKPYVVWNVFAAPEFSLDMRSFCYPVAGCLSYRGYFKQNQARIFAAGLKHEGHDVFVGGVAAYSTLGWFSDPVLDTFLRRSDVNLSALLFHELAHRVVFVPGDTRFNESFATAIEENSLKRWLKSTKQEHAYLNYLDARKRRGQVLKIIGDARELLGQLYVSGVDAGEMRTGKEGLIRQLRANYLELSLTWDGHEDFKHWMSGEINNAKLGTINDYNGWVPAFNALLAENDGDLERFIEAVTDASKLKKKARDEFLASRLSGCQEAGC